MSKTNDWYQIYFNVNEVVVEMRGKTETEKRKKELQKQYPDITFKIRKK